MHSISFPSLDGTPLGGAWHLSPAPRAVAVISPAMAVPSRFYRHFADELARMGLSTLRFDYRGIGDSRQGSVRGHSATATTWGRLDLSAAIDQALDHAAGLPVVLVGHSFGGQALGLTGRGPDLAAVLTIGSQSGYWRHWDGLPRAGMWAFMTLWIPLVSAALGEFPGWAGMKEDVPAGAVREWARWCRSPGYLTDHSVYAREHFRQIGGPVRVVGIGDDGFAPPRAVDALAAWFGDAERITVRPEDHGLDSIGHFGFFHPSRRKLWMDQAQWLLRATGALTRETGWAVAS